MSTATVPDAKLWRLDRGDLIRLVEEHGPSAAIRRRCADGRVELLGLFERVPPFNTPGFIIAIHAIWRTKPDLVGVGEHPSTRRLRVWQVGRVPWESWAGDGDYPSTTNGDNPTEYRRNKENAQ
jgi:hypothetical protein